jgi:hypothetical protein
MASVGHHVGWVYDQQGAQRCSSEREEIPKCDWRKLGGAEGVAGADGSGRLRRVRRLWSPLCTSCNGRTPCQTCRTGRATSPSAPIAPSPIAPDDWSAAAFSLRRGMAAKLSLRVRVVGPMQSTSDCTTIAFLTTHFRRTRMRLPVEMHSHICQWRSCSPLVIHLGGSPG